MQMVLYAARKKEKRLTQQAVADYLGISVQQYRYKEQGKYPFTQDEMFLLSALFDKRMDELFQPRNKED